MRVAGRERLGLGLLWATACAHGAPAGAPPSGPSLPAGSIARLDGEPIEATALGAATRTTLCQLEDEARLRRFAVLWGGAEEALAERLLAREAAARGISPAALIAAEVERRVGEPSDQEIADLYRAHREAIGAPLEQVASQLRHEWHDDRVAQLRHALIDRLREAHAAQITLAPPELSRQSVPLGPFAARGPEAAPVTVVVFGDVGCRFSAQARRLMGQAEARYPSQLRWTWRGLPADGEAGHHPALEAAFCAHEQHQFWPFMDLLFERGVAASAGELEGHAAALGLDAAAFRDCMGSLRPQLAVQQAQRDADRLGIRGTPALFINGMQVPGTLPFGALEALLAPEMGAPRPPR